MSKFKTIAPIESMQKKMRYNSNTSSRILYGVQHTYTWNPETVIQPTVGRLIQKEAMAQSYAEARRIYADPVAKQQYIDLQQRAKFKGPTNSFIVKQLYPGIKAALLRDWSDRPIEELQAYINAQTRARLSK